MFAATGKESKRMSLNVKTLPKDLHDAIGFDDPYIWF